MCNMGASPWLRSCCSDDEITIVPNSEDAGQFGSQRGESAVVIQQPFGDGEMQMLDVSGNTPREEKLDMSHQIFEERASQMALREQPIRSLMPLPMPPIKEGFEPYCPTQIESINEVRGEYPVKATPQPMSSYHTFARQDNVNDIPLLTTNGEFQFGMRDAACNQDVHGRSGVTLPEVGAAIRTPRGDYLISEAADVAKVTSHDLTSMEQMIAKMAGSPLGCINFEETFRIRHQNNQVLTLRGHSFEGCAFGDITAKHQKVTMLALKSSEGRVMWAPAPYVRLNSSDAILLIDCTPFAMAMGLANDASLSASSLTPSSTPPVTERSFLSFRDPSARQGDREDKPRRCCV